MNFFKASANKTKNLMDSFIFLSLSISTGIIFFVQVVSVFIISYFLAEDLNGSAAAEADQIASVLVEPLYNIDDTQIERIIETMLSSGRVSGVFLESSATGVLYDKRPKRISPRIPPQVRRVNRQGLYLGMLEIHYSDALLRDIERGVFTAMMIVVAAVVGANFLANRMLIRNRVKGVFGTMIRGISEIAEGKYERRLDPSGYDDMDSIIRVINEMSDKIISKNEELRLANAGLEERVAERTRELESSLNEQRKLQDRLVETGKLTALGQLSAGIAHELNTPLGAIQSSARSLTGFLDESLSAPSTFVSGLDGPGRLLYEKVLVLGFEANRTLSGQPAGRKVTRRIASELGAAGIRDSEGLAERLADIGLADSVGALVPLLATGRDLEIVAAAGEAVTARRMVEVINESSRKAALVVSALRSYLSPDSDDENRVIDLAEGISRVLTLMHNELKRGIEVTTRLASAKVRGSSDKFSQVWMNIIRNAAEAMEYQGSLEINVEKKEDVVLVRIIDSGPGISSENQEQVFKPFFTTKQFGEGMGLGLDICKRIVESRKGSIGFISRPGRTEFIVTLPAAQEG